MPRPIRLNAFDLDCVAHRDPYDAREGGEWTVDGFNLTCAITPGTLREKLFGAGPRLPESHPGAAYRRRELALTN